MKELVERFPENPILTPPDVRPTREDMVVECLLNPGVFRFKSRTGLLLRVAERPRQEDRWLSTPLLDPRSEGGIRILRIRKDDPDLTFTDSRLFDYQGRGYLTTLSHLRLAWSDDGVHFTPEERPALQGEGSHETFGIEDCRVEFIEGAYRLTYTAVSDCGVGVGLISTEDWRNFTRHGVIFPPHNKDCALFPEKFNGVLPCTAPSEWARSWRELHLDQPLARPAALGRPSLHRQHAPRCLGQPAHWRGRGSGEDAERVA
jgi:predicted GH43/DUF377 family glycosyl hydrolase